MAQGAGGEAMQEMIKELVLKNLEYPGENSIEIPLSALDDSAVVGDIVFTTDSHTVRPIFFPGGDIGSLSVAGTVNDVSVMGARPLALSLAMVIEEGLESSQLERILKSVGDSSRAAGVPVVTGDTKVVEHGALQKIIMTTSGIGRRSPHLDTNFELVRESRPFDSRWLIDSNVADGDVIIFSGSIGDHGVALLSFREGYEFETELTSDVTCLNTMIDHALAVGGITSMKDATRGGVSNTLNEWSAKSGVGIIICEDSIPLKDPVKAACGMLGIDPMEIGNEGKAVIAVVPEMADEVLASLQKTKEGKGAAIVGRASRDIRGVVLETSIGGRRIVEPPIADPVPRIC